MANNIEQIALVKVRQGGKDELPYALNDGEFGFATDTLEVLIGASMNPKMLQRMNDKVYPYGNLRILTELDIETLAENLKVLNYIYKGNTPTPTLFPVIFKGSVFNPVLTADSDIVINDVNISFTNDSDLAAIVETINNANVPFTNAYDLGNRLVIVSTDNDVKIVQESGKFLQDTGLVDGEEQETGQIAKDLTQNTLQSVLDNYLSIKYFNVKGDGITDDTDNINNALLGTYSVSDAPVYLRCLYVPAGEYLVNDSISLPSNTRLIGEGKGRSVFKTGDTTSTLIGLLDTNKVPFTSDSFSSDLAPENITIENMTFDGSDSSATYLLKINGGKDITFRNCEFIGNTFNDIVLLQDNNSHITFDNCDFKNCRTAIYTDSNEVDMAIHPSIVNCKFDNCSDEAIDLSKSNQVMIFNCCFIDCGSAASPVIMNNETALLTSIYNCQFGDNIGFDKTIKPYVNNGTLKTDILDSSTANEDMVYKFKTPQPVWGYVDDLRNPNGEYIVRAYYDETSNVINYLYIKAGTELSDKVEIYTSDKFKEMQLAGGEYATLVLGDSETARYPLWQANVAYNKDDYVVYAETVYKAQRDHTSVSVGDLSNTTLWVQVVDFNDLYIKLGKRLDLNGFPITNQAGGDIVFETNDGVLIVEDENYTSKIDNINNALANVGYVKQNVASKIIKKYIDMSEMISSESWNLYDLGVIDSASYSNNVYVRNVNISVEHIFNEVDYTSILDWESGAIYYEGDSVRHNSRYYICRETNADEVFNIRKWQEIDLTTKAPKTVELTALKSSGTAVIVHGGEVNLYEREKAFPNVSNIRNDIGQSYQFTYARHENMADATFTLSLLDEDGNLATMLQPAGKLFVMIEVVLDD